VLGRTHCRQPHHPPFRSRLDNGRFWHLRQDTCAMNEIEVDGEEFTLVSMNDTCHLRSSEAERRHASPTA